MVQVGIDRIVISDRHRRDLGDLADLGRSLREVGQLQPVVVTSQFRLIAGERRIAAARSIGWDSIEAQVVEGLSDAALLLRAERDENLCRKNFTVTEEHSLYQALLALEGRHGLESKPSGAPEEAGVLGSEGVPARTRASVAQMVGGAPGRYKTLDLVGEVKAIAESSATPDTVAIVAREALAEMDATGEVAASHRRVVLALKARRARDEEGLSGWITEELDLRARLERGETVVVSLRDNHAHLVRWCLANGTLYSIDRRTEWGNPFEMPGDGDRSTVIQNYRVHYLPNKPSLISRIGELKGKALACWCAPLECHGDVLKEFSDLEMEASGGE